MNHAITLADKEQPNCLKRGKNADGQVMIFLHLIRGMKVF